ncbi:MAG: hypothetical protein ACTSWE_08635 [Promethearchaeota archaeon]
MEESEKENLFSTFKAVIDSIIIDKKRNPKNLKLLNTFKARVNIGLQLEKDYYFWVNLTGGGNGEFNLERDKLDDFDLEIMADPEDLLYFSNGEYSILHMLLKKNKFGFRKLRFNKGTTGRNLGLLLKLPKLLVLDKV